METARVTTDGVEFRFTPALPIAPPARSVRSAGAAARSASAASDPDVLHVQRRGENEISFPGCTGFPYPLVRCPAR